MNQSSPRSWLTALGAGGASGRAVAAGAVMDGPVPDVGSQAPLRGHPHPAPSSAPGPGTREPAFWASSRVYLLAEVGGNAIQ